VLGCSEGAIPWRATTDIVRDPAGVDGGESQFVRAAHTLQKSAYGASVILHRRRRKAGGVSQPGSIFPQYPVDRGCPGPRHSLALSDTFFLKPARYAGDRDLVALAGATALGVIAQECFLMFGRELARRSSLGPTTGNWQQILDRCAARGVGELVRVCCLARSRSRAPKAKQLGPCWSYVEICRHARRYRIRTARC
jgi:hypothetical protein